MIATRVTQLVTRTLSAGLITLAAFLTGTELSADQAAQLESLITPVAIGIVGIGGFLIDLYLHRLQTPKTTRTP